MKRLGKRKKNWRVPVKSANELRQEGREEMREAIKAAIEKKRATYWLKNWSHLHDLSGLNLALTIVEDIEVEGL